MKNFNVLSRGEMLKIMGGTGDTDCPDLCDEGLNKCPARQKCTSTACGVNGRKACINDAEEL